MKASYQPVLVALLCLALEHGVLAAETGVLSDSAPSSSSIENRAMILGAWNSPSLAPETTLAGVLHSGVSHRFRGVVFGSEEADPWGNSEGGSQVIPENFPSSDLGQLIAGGLTIGSTTAGDGTLVFTADVPAWSANVDGDELVTINHSDQGVELKQFFKIESASGDEEINAVRNWMTHETGETLGGGFPRCQVIGKNVDGPHGFFVRVVMDQSGVGSLENTQFAQLRSSDEPGRLLGRELMAFVESDDCTDDTCSGRFEVRADNTNFYQLQNIEHVAVPDDLSIRLRSINSGLMRDVTGLRPAGLRTDGNYRYHWSADLPDDEEMSAELVVRSELKGEIAFVSAPAKIVTLLGLDRLGSPFYSLIWQLSLGAWVWLGVTPLDLPSDVPPAEAPDAKAPVEIFQIETPVILFEYDWHTWEDDWPVVQAWPRVFISYSDADRLWAEGIQNFLATNAIRSFVSHRDIACSEHWRERIFAELRGSDVLIAVISKNYRASEFCNGELGHAAVREDCDVIPISIDGTASPVFIDDIQAGRLETLEDLGTVLLPAIAAVSAKRNGTPAGEQAYPLAS